jgi:hypothetical protein
MKAPIRSVALIGSLVLLLAACSSRADGLTTTTTAGNGATTSSTTTTAPAVTSPEDLLDELASLWIDGDWVGMAEIAEPGVVATAEEWGQGDLVNVVWIPSCKLGSSGTGTCELLFSPPDYDGNALIFSAGYTRGGGGELSIVELTFGGDAG